MPEEIQLRPSVISYAGVVSTSITIGEGNARRIYRPGDVIRTADLLGPDGSFRTSALAATITVLDSAGRTTTESVRLPLRPAQMRVAPSERYRLILFPFNSADINADHRATLTMISASLQPSATVRIIGLTDTMGSSEHNLELSARRAEAVARALDVPLSNARGLGSQQPLLSNGLPEGRAYHRTVVIEVQPSTSE